VETCGLGKLAYSSVSLSRDKSEKGHFAYPNMAYLTQSECADRRISFVSGPDTIGSVEHFVSIERKEK